MTNTLTTTIQNALIMSSNETREIIAHINEDETLTYGEKYELIDDILAHAMTPETEAVPA